MEKNLKNPELFFFQVEKKIRSKKAISRSYSIIKNPNKSGISRKLASLINEENVQMYGK